MGEQESFYGKASKALARVPSKFGPDIRNFRRHRTIQEFWNEWFDAEEPAKIDGPRLFTAWRIIREMARIRGVLTDPRETLLEATRVAPSPWAEPFALHYAHDADARIRQLCRREDTPLLPPDVPEKDLRNPTYSPNQDKALMTYLRIAEYVAINLLKVNQTRDGRLGLTGLLDPAEARHAWPHQDAIMAYEDYLIGCVYRAMVSADGDGGDTLTRDELRRLGLSARETEQLMVMARARAPKMAGLDDPKTFLYMQLAKMDSLADKMTAREDYRGAAQARRDVVRILTAKDQSQDEEDLDGIVEIEMRKESKKRRKSPDEEGMM